MRPNFKLIILVMCSSKRHFKKLENAIKRTWGSVSPPGITILFYRDNQGQLFKKKTPVLKQERDLVLPCQDGYAHCTEKTLQAFEYVAANYDFQYVCRTNLGSYINLSKILNFLADKPLTGFYSGIIGYSEAEGVSFASGSCYFLSRDLVQLCTKGRAEFDFGLIDDVSLGKFLAGRGIGPDKSAIRLSYTDHGVEYQMGDSTLSCLDNNLVYHVRLRSHDRKNDIKKMHELFNMNF